jgi:hypothetical protein
MLQLIKYMKYKGARMGPAAGPVHMGGGCWWSSGWWSGLFVGGHGCGVGICMGLAGQVFGAV